MSRRDDEFKSEENVPEEVLEAKNMFKSYRNGRELSIQCPTWAVKDPGVMDRNADEPGWFPYALNLDGETHNIYIHNSFKKRFIADPGRALRDIGAFPTTTGSFFYSNRYLIRRHANKFRFDPVEEGNRLSPRFKGDEGKDYYIHVDLATSNDSTGIAMGHIDGTFYRDGKYYPKIFVDLVFEMNPKDYGGEVMIHNVRQFIMELRNVYKFNITDISFDSWQSKDSQQLLSTEGFKTHQISVDRTPYPHQALKEAINLCDPETGFFPINYYEHDKLCEELEGLVYKSNGVPDHTASSSKDIADGLAGLTYLITQINMAKLNNYIIIEEVDIF